MPASPSPRSPQASPEAGRSGFAVRLDNFEGPFDLLLGLITKHQLDVTEVALARVTDDFIAHLRAASRQEEDFDLDEASEFLLVAATLLDLKAARLLPAADVEDPEDLALLEARDLLFARLLQYRAYKQVAALLAERFEQASRRVPRAVAVEPHFEKLLPELVLTVSREQFAAIAARALTPRPTALVDLDHLHSSAVSVREQASLVVDRLRRAGTATFAELVADAGDGELGTLVVVARFLAVLELFRERRVRLEQPEALGELTVRWDAQVEAERGAAAAAVPAGLDEFEGGTGA
ncbi:segregation and condensation protein A [Kineococcus radiotolerans]|uniref:Segregation and condensation protein A n=2 Tax=Kineococcus radiotolerans TaxID=131568 RepID=A6WCP7_KINRD|nr:ScpA family protein [Kineococcus radiotolerans]ABS04586.1 chromosome segregation and condensation protein ScpA [Kineococcus radiotolerans SRS30216 = ATCC BAA-149]MBB2902740.1 segregation and condensation protein A [Kineococcus radiotolerans]